MTAARARIAASGTTSNAVDIGKGSYLTLGIETPAALTTSTAITFSVARSLTGIFVPLYDTDGNGNSNEVSIPVVVNAARGISVPAQLFAGWAALKIVVADAQAADRDFYVTMRG